MCVDCNTVYLESEDEAKNIVNVMIPIFSKILNIHVPSKSILVNMAIYHLNPKLIGTVQFEHLKQTSSSMLAIKTKPHN